MQEVFKKIIERLGRCCEMQKDMIGRKSRYSMNDETYEHGARMYENAIEIVKQVAAEYNNGWIPISSGRLPKECEDVEVTIEEINEVGEKQYYNVRSWLQDGRWVIKKNPYNPTVIAWRYPTQPYVPKGE